VLFNGANVSEQIAIFDNGGRLGLTRDIAAITLDAGGMERVDLNVRGGADTVRVFDLAATSVARVNVDVASTRAAPATRRPTWSASRAPRAPTWSR
jgi:hypothetical protein